VASRSVREQTDSSQWLPGASGNRLTADSGFPVRVSGNCPGDISGLFFYLCPPEKVTDETDGKRWQNSGNSTPQMFDGAKLHRTASDAGADLLEHRLFINSII
jgi:hypothetical protein